MRPWLKLTFRFLGTAFALFLVYRKMDVRILLHRAGQIGWGWFLLAFFFLNLSQILSAFRFRYYLSTIGVRLRSLPALALHFKGLFLNSFLPGGVGGDAYKIVALKERGTASLKKLIQVSFSNRANGLLCLFFLGMFMVPSSERIKNAIPHGTILAVSLFSGITLIYFGVAKFLLNEPLAIQLKAGVYSIGVQLFMVFTVGALFFCLDGHAGMVEYLFIFLASSIAAALPLSIGGLGIRELVLFKGSAMLGIDADFGVLLAALFFGIYLLSGAFGIAFFWVRGESS